MKMPGLSRRGAPSASKYAALRWTSFQMTDRARGEFIRREIEDALKLPTGLLLYGGVGLRYFSATAERVAYELAFLGYFEVLVEMDRSRLVPSVIVTVRFGYQTGRFLAAPRIDVREWRPRRYDPSEFIPLLSSLPPLLPPDLSLVNCRCL